MDQHSNQLRTALRKEGLRYTRQRQAVWDDLRSSNEHRDAEDIYLALKNNDLKVSRATVYRTIDVLVKNDMVRKLELGDGRSRYEHKMETCHHDHLICIRCGRIEEFVDEQIEKLQREIARQRGYRIIRHIHQLFGICSQCKK